MMINMSLLLLFNKPYGVLSQFSGASEQHTLSEYIDIPNVYPAGRLDKDSEGLLLLTDDGKLQHDISHPKKKMLKQYWVQVEGIPNNHALKQLREGVSLKDHQCLPAKIQRIDAPSVWERDPPIRDRKSIPTSWLKIGIKEGKNRQVRRMTAQVGYPTLRLIRSQIGPWQLGQLKPGEYQVLNV